MTKRIACSCRTCKTNAASSGAPFPLAVDVPAAWDTDTSKRVHGLVHTAHHPVLGRSASVTANVRTVTA